MISWEKYTMDARPTYEWLNGARFAYANFVVV